MPVYPGAPKPPDGPRRAPAGDSSAAVHVPLLFLAPSISGRCANSRTGGDRSVAGSVRRVVPLLAAGVIDPGGTLTVMPIASHPAEPFDLGDLIDAPDDGYRYEVVDGALVVNAAPSWHHQRVVLRLARLLEDGAGEDLIVLAGPVWRIGPGQVPEPDVVVAERTALGAYAVDGVPALVAEVLSPSNRGADLVRKRALYAEAGCPNYWIVDPEAPSVLVLALGPSGYEDVGRAVGEQAVVVDRPFTVRLVPAELVAD